MTRRVTIVDVAERAGVAISSVSSALNDRPGVSEETRRRILAVADELGFVRSVRARSLSAQRAFAVGLAVQRDADVLESDPFFGAFIGGVESVLSTRGSALVLQLGVDRAHTLSRYRELAAARRVDGVFLSDIEVDDPRVELLQSLRMPAVGINPDRDFPFPSVRQDGDAGIAELLGHLRELGHRRVAHVRGPEHAIHARSRERAWREAERALGLEPGPLLRGDFTFESGLAAADALLALDERPSAVFCSNDLMAVGVMARFEDLGLRIPDDLSVAGYDGVAMGDYVRPTLTTLRTTPRRIGEEAARMLLELIDGGEAADVDVEPVELVVRGSTGPFTMRG